MPPFLLPDDTGISYLIILTFFLLGTASRLFYSWMTGNPINFLLANGQIVIQTFASSLKLMIAIRLETSLAIVELFHMWRYKYKFWASA